MTDQNKSAKSDKKDPSTYTAYGDPINDTHPSLNDQHTKATSPIAQSTQNVSSGRINPDTKKDETSAYGDPIIDNSTSPSYEYKLSNSAVAKSTQTKNTDTYLE
ncbi:MAG: hypothetical protein ABWX58_00355 [Psychrobacillus psychrotolerans]